LGGGESGAAECVSVRGAGTGGESSATVNGGESSADRERSNVDREGSGLRRSNFCRTAASAPQSYSRSSHAPHPCTPPATNLARALHPWTPLTASRRQLRQLRQKQLADSLCARAIRPPGNIWLGPTPRQALLAARDFSKSPPTPSGASAAPGDPPTPSQISTRCDATGEPRAERSRASAPTRRRRRPALARLPVRRRRRFLQSPCPPPLAFTIPSSLRSAHDGPRRPPLRTPEQAGRRHDRGGQQVRQAKTKCAATYAVAAPGQRAAMGAKAAAARAALVAGAL
jgi:uncharacterized protein YjiS (DUF1127 family)